MKASVFACRFVHAAHDRGGKMFERIALLSSPRAYVGLTLATLLMLSSPTTAFSQAPGDISIAVQDLPGVDLGTYIDVEITLQNISDGDLGGFDLLFQYDTDALTFVGTEQGQLLIDCAWEYFTWRLNGDLVRIVTIADINNGDNHPDCYLANTDGTLAVLNFYVTNDHSLTGQSFPVQFYWADCGDNNVADRTGDIRFISRYVYDWLNHDPIHEDDEFPTIHGAPDICVAETSIRTVDFTSGNVKLILPSTDRGDLNLNQIAYELSDWILFKSYFLSGLQVFVIDLERQIAASDVNADDIPLQVRDWVYLMRVVIGDANPFPRGGMGIPDETATFVQDTSLQRVSVEYSGTLGAAHLVFTGQITPTLFVPDMSCEFEITDDSTLVLIYSFGVDDSFGDGPLLWYDGQGILKSVDVADYENTDIPTAISIVSGYLCGDTDRSRWLDIDDVVFLVSYVFAGGPPPEPFESGDANCSGIIDIDDILFLMQSIFDKGPLPCDTDGDGVPDC